MNKGLAQREIMHSTNIKEVRKVGKYLPTVLCKWTNYVQAMQKIKVHVMDGTATLTTGCWAVSTSINCV